MSEATTYPPVEQERKVGNELLPLGNDIFAEVSTYKGRTFGSVRRWFQADDGRWYRTKNGLHVHLEDLVEVVAQCDALSRFLVKRQGEVEASPRFERNVSPGSDG